MKRLVIDLNADLGESPNSVADGTDGELMRYISSANIACGGHAGDERTMRTTLRLAKDNQVSAGAHPSFPDRENFGRVEMRLPSEDLERSLVAQIRGLQSIAQEVGISLAHVKPHGALYHAGNRDPEVAKAIERATLACDRSLILVGKARSACLEIWRGMGLTAAAEAFADRVYEADGTLRKRTLPGALLASEDDAVRQALSIALDHRVRAFDGSEIQLTAKTICLHSDTPGAGGFARRIRQELEQAGCEVRALCR
jgi:5-oxoprolinase (ATP-hydrolysing) subunit A